MIMNIGIFSLIMSFSSNGLLLKYLINWSFLKKWNIFPNNVCFNNSFFYIF
jgi:hypothetical protein